jgi:transposase, IS5 family
LIPSVSWRRYDCAAYWDFTHVAGGKMPDAKTMSRWGLALEPEVLKQIHQRIV